MSKNKCTLPCWVSTVSVSTTSPSHASSPSVMSSAAYAYTDAGTDTALSRRDLTVPGVMSSARAPANATSAAASSSAAAASASAWSNIAAAAAYFDLPVDGAACEVTVVPGVAAPTVPTEDRRVAALTRRALMAARSGVGKAE